jgi:circadian clock protein KaiC
VTTQPQDRCSLGVPGLDDVLSGGLVPDRVYLLQGQPGTGKTTLALQFLFAGRDRGEPVLYITLSETREEILEVARSHGFSLEGVSLYELSTAEETLRLQDVGTMYATSDVELQETMRVLLDEVERVKPTRVVFDSLSEIRLLSQTQVRFRRQLLALKQHFARRRSTVLLLDDLTAEPHEPHLASIAHGVISLEQVASSYGVDRRRLRVTKLRGSPFRSGYHDFVIRKVA